jgi:hypothetical protein
VRRRISALATHDARRLASDGVGHRAALGARCGLGGARRAGSARGGGAPADRKCVLALAQGAIWREEPSYFVEMGVESRNQRRPSRAAAQTT